MKVNIGDIFAASARRVFSPGYIRLPSNYKGKPVMWFDGVYWVCGERGCLFNCAKAKTAEKAYKLYKKVNSGEIKTGHEHEAKYPLIYRLMNKRK